MDLSLKNRICLRTPSTEWIFDDTNRSVKIEKLMIHLMLDNQGIGLAANQIGFDKKVFVMGSYQIENFPEPFALFNPEIIECSDDLEIDNEGCLSFPDLVLSIKRPKAIKVRFQDVSGSTEIREFDGLAARCFQHELDHLYGICFVDKVSQLKLQYAYRKLRKHYDRTQ